MNNRRKFLLQGSMATTALLIAKPFETLAKAMAPVSGFTINNDKVIFAHTGNHLGNNPDITLEYVSALKRKTNNLVLVHAGKTNDAIRSNKAFDVMMDTQNPLSLTTNDYKIIYKGNIKIGLITVNESNTELFQSVNQTSTWLKKEKACHLVVCLSQLGYKQKNNIDDITLAENTTDLDIIIGGHASNYCKAPLTVKNKNMGEVIINHAADNELALRKIEIEFTVSGKKKHIAFTRSVPVNTIAKTS